MTAERFLTVNQVAERLQVSTRTVRRWLSDGKLQGTHFGRAVRISERELQRFIEEGSGEGEESQS